MTNDTTSPDSVDTDAPTDAPTKTEHSKSVAPKFEELARQTRKELKVIETQTGKVYELLLRRGFRSGDMLVGIAMMYGGTLRVLEEQQEGLGATTHDFMKGVFDEMLAIYVPSSKQADVAE